jgi:hypothetical protein
MRKQMVLLSFAAALILVSGSYAQDKQPFLGVLLDESPLPELLTKHLGLEPGQGLRVVNVSAGTTADRAGLERDDLVVAFQGQKVTDLDEFIAALKKAGVGAKITLEIIHLGQRKILQLELEPLGEMKWKYPPEPEIITYSGPVHIFKIGPDGQQVEIPFNEFPDLSNLFRYTYECTAEGENYTITIEGSPASDATKITVRAGETEYSATVGEIDKLPEKYRNSARQAVRNAKENVQITTSLRVPDPLQREAYKKLFSDRPGPDMERLSQEKDRTIERLRQEMKELQQRMQELEQRHREVLDKLLNRKDNAEPKSDKTGPSASVQDQEKPSV